MKKSRLKELDVLIGAWGVTLPNSWFMDSLETTAPAKASFEWVEDAFVLYKFSLGDGDVPEAVVAIDYSGSQDKFEAFYYDQRGVSRIFAMEFGDGRWTMLREDPDFYQRFSSQVAKDSIKARWEASDDKGKSWRIDYDRLFTRPKP